MSEWSLQTAAVEQSVSVDEALLHLRVDVSDETAYVFGLIQAAESWVEAYTSRSLRTQTWLCTQPEFCDVMRLPRATPLQSVTHVKYYDFSNVLQTASSSLYTVRTECEPGTVELVNTQSWPSSVGVRNDAVRITYVAGWTSAQAVPGALKQAVLLLVGHWFLRREAVAQATLADIPLGVEALCAPWRVWL
jgi:uncharacterized phiE125 gp8 family phage protein